MATEGDLALVLLEKARGEARALEALTDHADVPDAIAGFHAQQAVEKPLKAVLASHRIEYRYSHDLEYLVELLPSELDLPLEVEAGSELTPWAIEFRYEDPPGEHSLDRERALAIVSALLDWAGTTVSG